MIASVIERAAIPFFEGRAKNVRIFSCFLLLACFASGFASTASAQFWGVNVPIGKSVGLTVGSGNIAPYGGYGYGGYGYGGYGPGYGYGRGPGYYAPPVVITAQPAQRHYHHYHTQTAAPAYSSAGVDVSSVLVQSPAASQAVSSVPQNIPKAKSYPGGQIIISNPADSGQPLSYLLNGHEYTIQPGHEQKFAEDRDWVIAFGSGGKLGDVKYSLHEGSYQFRSGSDGWELQKQQPPQNSAAAIK
jgi:hypothetical protein